MINRSDSAEPPNSSQRSAPRAEADALSHARVEGARRAAGELLAPLAHDLRSGLTGILGWAQVLERVTDEATRGRAIDGIRRAVAHQTRLAEDVADAGRALLAAREGSDVPEDIDFAATMRAAASELAEAARTRDVEFRFAAAAGVPTIRGDPELIRRLAHLLLGDALLQAPTGGAIAVSMTGREEAVVIELGDVGTGGDLETVADLTPVESRHATGNVRRAIAALVARVLGGQVTPGRSGMLQATLPRRYTG